MNTAAEPASLRPPSRARGRLGWLAAGVALACYLYSPVTQVMEPSLDASNYASYAYFAAHHFQYGTDVVPMYGPLGYVLPWSAYNGEQFWPRLFGQLAIAGSFAALLLWFFQQARGIAWRWPWLALVLLLAPYIDDLPAELAILLAGLLLLTRPGRLVSAAVVGLLAFLSLIKGTHLILALATLGLVMAQLAGKRDWLRALWLGAGYAAAFLGCWLMAGQRPGNIPAFLRGIAVLTDGYNAAMALEETPGVFYRGLLTLGVLVTGLAWGAWHGRKNSGVVTAALLFAGFTFVLWKHGFVRADGHIAIFHHYAAIAAVSWFLFLSVNHAPARRPAPGLMLAGLLTALWINSPALGPGHLTRLLTEWPAARLRANFAQLSQPSRSKANLDARLAHQREAFALRLIQEDVGAQPVDLFGLRHGIIPLNNLNYHPRPMGGGSFNVYNPYLMGLNRDFLRDPAKRPPFYLMRFETIDDRFGTQDDGLALLELIQRYRPVRAEDGYLLLQDSGRGQVEPTPLASCTFKFNEPVTVPPVPGDRLLVARFTIAPSFAGILRRFFYKAPPVVISFPAGDPEQTTVRRVIPDMAASPFLFSPLVENNRDFLTLFSTLPGRTVRDFVLVTPDHWAFAGRLKVEFSTLPRPPQAHAPDATELLADPAALFNPPPTTLAAADTRPLYLGRLQVQPLHAPGSISWMLDGTETGLTFDHGLMPEAYERGHGNGVAFIVELHRPGKVAQVLFERLVNPLANPAERRTLTSRVTLPPHVAGSRLTLRTDPGPHGDNAWDWSYVTRVQLRKDLASPGGKALFNRVPIALEGSAPVMATLEGHEVVMLHVPGALTLALQGDEKKVELGFGFMPGAYTGEGRTQGADFVVELLQAGAAPRELFRRGLHPVSTEGDRGPQSAVVALPAIAAGDRLVVRTMPVPGGSPSWGWTYFSRCDIE